MGASLPVSAASTTYTSRDIPELLRLTSAVKRFRELLSKTMSQWSSKLEKKDSLSSLKDPER
jgi:DNA-binding transcriptional regulator YbjK